MKKRMTPRFNLLPVPSAYTTRKKFGIMLHHLYPHIYTYTFRFSLQTAYRLKKYTKLIKSDIRMWGEEVSEKKIIEIIIITIEWCARKKKELVLRHKAN